MTWFNDEDRKLLSEVQPGGTVYRKLSGQLQVLRVDRVTPTQIIIGSARYRKRDGHPVGEGTWSSYNDYILPPTAEHRKTVTEARADIKRQRAKNVARDSFARLLITDDHIDLVTCMLEAANNGQDVRAALRLHLVRGK